MFTASKNVKISLFLCLMQLRLSNCQNRPHIIFILADDLGFNDVGFHGSSQIPTPNIDALAYSGLILNNYYVNPICTPSRSALMTGKHPIHTGMQHTVLYGGEPRGLSLEETLLPQHLKKLGYTNRIVGKWHLGSWKLKYTPTYRGFDSHLGFWTGHHDYNDHTAMENAMWGLDMRRNEDVAHDLHGKYSTDVFTNEAVRLISTHNTSKPLFLYLAHAAVHSGNPYNPLAAPDNIVAKFTHIDDYNRRRFAGVLSKLDESVGLVVKALRNAKMLSDSIIVFSTDNGGPADGFNLNAASNWPLRGVKNTLWEGGVRGAGLLWSPLLTKTKRVATQMMHITDWLPTLYAAAGGNTTDLGKLDGYNLWDVLSKDERSTRNDVLHNIDDIYGNAALTLGPWKIIKATVGSITDGLQYGWSSPVVPKLLSPDSPVHIEETHIAWIESLYMIGGIAGLPITIFLVNKVGRKLSILLAAVAHLVAWILLAFATNIEMILAGRFITGMAADIAFVAVPMYIAELSHQKIRGFLTGFIYLGSLIGIIIVYSVGPYVEIYVLSIIGGVFDVLQLLSLSFLPRSPYYLLVKEDKDEAKKALQFFRGTKDVDAELAEIAAAVQRQQHEKGRPVDLVLDKGNRKALIIMTVLNASQHFGSLSVMLMNIHTILYDAATIIDANMAAYIFSIVQFIAAVCALSMVDKYGRKSLLITSSFLTGISLALLATYFAVRDSGVDVSAYNWVPVASVLLYAAAFRCGLGIVPIVMTGELFSTRMKAIGMTTVDAMYVIFGTIAIFLYQELSNLYGLYCPFYIFAGCCVLTALFTIFYIPETNKKTLEEIQFILKGLPIENSHM